MREYNQRADVKEQKRLDQQKRRRDERVARSLEDDERRHLRERTAELKRKLSVLDKIDPFADEKDDEDGDKNSDEEQDARKRSAHPSIDSEKRANCAENTAVDRNCIFVLFFDLKNELRLFLTAPELPKAPILRRYCRRKCLFPTIL